MQITGDNPEGKRELDNFINPEERYPVIATTSKLMTTGIDAQTCKLIVLDSNIASMTEFKQIIGRGTRINEEFNKLFFTIIDFRNVTDLFADSSFDGDPVRIKEYDQGQELETDQDEENDATEIIDEEDGSEVDFEEYSVGEIKQGGVIVSEPREKYYVNGVDVSVLNERVQYLDSEGKMITGSLKNYTKVKIKEHFKSLDDFLNKWNSDDRKLAIIKELEENGIILENLIEDISKDMDIFDLVCHAAFDMPPLTRKERAENVKKRNYFAKYGEQARVVLKALLDKYADEGVGNIESMEVLKLKPFNQYGSVIEIVKFFGSKQKYLKAVHELEDEIYRQVCSS